MGANLIGYIVVGPAELDKSQEKKDALIARAAIEKKLMDEISARLAEKELEGEAYAEQLEALTPEQRKYVEGLSESRENEGFAPGEESVETLLEWAEETGTPESVESIIDDLFALWGGGARDAMSRPLPGDPSKRILCCGEPSWGDEPDGHGYQTLKKADQAGLLDAYDIL